MSSLNHQDQGFMSLQEKALESASFKADSLETLASDLQRFFNKNHRKQMEEIEEKIAKIEERCCQEAREAIEKHITIQLKKNFQEVALSCQNNVSQMFSSFLKETEENVRRLNFAVNRTNTLCEDIQKRYAFKWGKPFLTLIISTALVGALMGLGLFLLQASSVAVFLKNEETRAIYELDNVRRELQEYKTILRNVKISNNNAKKGPSSR